MTPNTTHNQRTQKKNYREASRTTIEDVARAAHVAPSTVSRALNGHKSVRAATRERVRKIVDELRYRPSRAARSLRFSRTRTLGVLVFDLSDVSSGPFICGAEHAAQQHDYSLLICDGQSIASVQIAQLERLNDNRVDGIIVERIERGLPGVAEMLRRLASEGIPLEPESALSPDELAEEILSRELGATRAAMRHLVDLGHRRFAFFVWSHYQRDLPDSILIRGRVAQMREAIELAGASPDCLHLIPVASGRDCLAHVQALSTLPSSPTAYIVDSHALTPLILSAVQQVGLQIPEDISFITYGDSDWAKAYRPRMAVIRHNVYEEARLAVERLVARLEPMGEATPPPADTLFEFRSRDSCGPSPSES